ncbi:TolC family protein [Congregibacter brevis]|uniref:TolC family protein n=1 Tax=Congregibacter brevis TaxID=3081201 RepID=A0ABZ0IG36_9GAMM|nr:TolC family protein [Congregibacter sp. IMCC45268]
MISQKMDDAHPIVAMFPLRSPTLALLAALFLNGCASTPSSRSVEPRAVAPTETLSERPIMRKEESDSDATRSLSEWVSYALANNPRVTAAIANYEAANNEIDQATALPDPRLNFRYFIDEVETRVGPQNFAVGISQPLPWLGKLRLQGDIASEKANAAATRVSTIQNDVIAEVAHAWYELYYFNRALKIMAGNRDLVQNLERVARTLYQTGSSSHADVIRAQVELGKIENDLASLTDREAPLLARLNAALNRSPQAPIKLPEEAPIVDVPLNDQSIVSRVIGNNPELRALSFDVAAAKAARERADKDFFPDFSIGLDYIATGDARSPDVKDSGKDPIAAVFSMTLPLQRGKYKAGVRSAEARIAAQRAQRAQHINRLEADTVSAVFRLRDARRQIDLYQTTLLPKANESLAATQRAYSAGSSPFADLIDAQRMLLIFELAEARAIADHNQARTTLEELIGESLAPAPANQGVSQ